MWTSWYWFLRNEKRIVLKRVDSWRHWLVQGVSVLTVASYTPYFPVDLLFLIDLGWTALTVIVVGKACSVLILEQCWQTSTELYVSKLQPSFTRCWFLLLITHSWLVICDWLSRAGLWPSSGLRPGDGVIWVMWHGLGCFSTLFHILSAISSQGYLKFAYLTEGVWRSWARLIHFLQSSHAAHLAAQ